MRPGRVARLILKIAGAVVLGVVLLAAIAVGVLHTHWGKEQVRVRAETAVNELLAGHLSIGAIEGTFFDRLVLRDIALDDAAGRPALRADSIAVDFDLFSLISQLALLEEVVIENPRALLVTEKDGALNLTKLIKEKNEPEPEQLAEPSAWTVRLDSARLHGGEVRYQAADGSTLAASAIELDASGKLAGDTAEVKLNKLATQLSEPALELSLSAAATKDGTQAAVQKLIMLVNQHNLLQVERATYDLASQQLEATFELRATRELLARLTRDEGWRGNVAIRGDLRHKNADAPWHAALAGTIAGAKLTAGATAAADLRAVALTANIAGLDPAAVHALAPPGKLRLALDAEVKGATAGDLRELEGNVALEGSGSIQRYRISRLELDAKAIRGRIDAALDANLEGAGTVNANALLDTNTVPLTITRAELTARIKELAAVLPKTTGVRGAVTADLKAKGQLGALLAEGTVNAQRITANTAHLDKARLRFELQQTPDALAVRVRELSASENRIALRMKNADLRLANNGVLTVDRAHLDSNAGDVGLYARIDTRRLLKAPGELRLALYDVDVARLRAAFFPDAPALHGVVRGELKANLDKKGPHAELQATVRNVMIREDVPMVALDVSAKVDGPEAHAQVTVTEKYLGKIVALADVRAPGDPTAPATWAKISERAIERLFVDLDKVSVKSLMAFAQPSKGVTGTLDGELELKRGGEDLRADLLMSGVRAEPLPMPVDVRLQTATKGGQIVNTIDVAMGKGRLLAAVVGVEHDLTKLKREGFAAFADADVEGTLNVDRFPMTLLADATEAVASIKKDAEPGTRAMRRSEKGKRLGLGTVDGTSGLDGVATLSLNFSRKNRESRAKLELHGKDLVWVNDAPKLDLELLATLERGKLEAKGFGRGKAVGGINLEAALQLPRDVFDGEAWARVDESAIQKLVFQFEALKLGEADKIAQRRLKLRGTIDGEVKVFKGARVANAELTLSEVRTEKMRTGVDGTFHARVDQDGSRIAIDTSHRGAKMVVGKIETSASLPDLLKSGAEKLGREKIDGAVTIEKLPMPLLAEMLRSQHDLTGAFSGQAKVFGTIGGPAIELELDGAGAKIDEHAFTALTVRAKIDPDRAVAEAHIRETRGGNLDLSANIGRKVDSRKVTAQLAAAKFPLGWITALIPPTAGIGGIAGRLDAAIELDGQLGDPNVRGRLDLADLKIGLAPPAPMLERAKVKMTFDGRKIALNLDGHSGGGDILAELTADLKRLDAPDFDAKVTTDELPIAVGPKQLLLDSVTRIQGRTEETMEIQVTVESGKIDIPNEGSEQYRRIAKLDDVVYEGGRLAVELDDGQAIQPMEILVGLRKQIPIYGDEINAVGDVQLELDNKSGAMEMSGYATVGNGYLNLFGKRWTIQQARIDFIRGEDPRVQVELTHDFGTAMVYVRVLGSPEQPELLVSSDPPIYDEAQLLMFVIGSGPDEDPSETTVGGQAAGIAANALLGEVQSKLEDKLPIDMLQLDVGDGAKPARLRLGRWLTSRIFLGYNFEFEADDDENVNEGVLQYRIGSGWMVESRYGDRGNGGVDAVWVKRF